MGKDRKVWIQILTASSAYRVKDFRGSLRWVKRRLGTAHRVIVVGLSHGKHVLYHTVAVFSKTKTYHVTR